MIRVEIVTCDLKILERGYIWLWSRLWIEILRSWNVGACMVRVKIVDGDLEILDRGYIWLGLRSWMVILRSWIVGIYG